MNLATRIAINNALYVSQRYAHRGSGAPLTDEQAAVLAGIMIAVVAILVLVFVIGWVKNRYF